MGQAVRRVLPEVASLRARATRLLDCADHQMAEYRRCIREADRLFDLALLIEDRGRMEPVRPFRGALIESCNDSNRQAQAMRRAREVDR